MEIRVKIGLDDRTFELFSKLLSSVTTSTPKKAEETQKEDSPMPQEKPAPTKAKKKAEKQEPAETPATEKEETPVERKTETVNMEYLQKLTRSLLDSGVSSKVLKAELHNTFGVSRLSELEESQFDKAADLLKNLKD